MLFRKKTPTDVQLVYKASTLLEISEFQFFSDAWKTWYNGKPSEKRIESYFVDFLENGAIPFWVRNHVRFTLNRKDLLAREKRRLIVGSLTYYLPLLVFFILILEANLR